MSHGIAYPSMEWYGTGSVLSEPKSGSPQAHFRNRASQVQSIFRKCSLWLFWKLDWLTKHNLFHFNLRNLLQRGQGDSVGPKTNDKEADLYKRKYGSVIPKNVPERYLFVFSFSYNKITSSVRPRPSFRPCLIRRSQHG